MDPFFGTNRIICGESSARFVYFCWCKQMVIDITMLFYYKDKLMAVAKKGFCTRKFCLMFCYLCNTVMSFSMFCCTQGNHSFCSRRFDYANFILRLNFPLDFNYTRIFSVVTMCAYIVILTLSNNLISPLFWNLKT